ncbi:MAG: putative 4-hydroxybenzoate polyprenyltransferase [Alistipes sp.]|nr:putative 4-hydroxybenzoate polyprenyltransferase [Alistipes sp.]
MNTISKYLSLVKFAHTIFAMPFALIGFTYAVSTLPEAAADSAPWQYRWLPLLVQVVLCMVFARNVAFGFNRWADRDIDAANPRTADRDIPAGRITPRAAMIFVVINAALFIVTAASINTLTAALSPVALAVVLVYSLCKRFTSMAHLVLGLSLGIAPVGAYIAVTGEFAAAPCVLAVLVMTWCAGFDIIYALQDAEFDRRAGLHSIPARFTAAQALGISTALHAASIAALVWFASFCPGSWLLWTGCALFTAILVAEHMLVTPTRQRHIGIAFGTLNGLASLTLAAFVIADLLLS